MVFSLPVLSCESSVSVRENSDRKKDELLNIGWSKLCRRQPLRSWNRYDLFNQILKQDFDLFKQLANTCSKEIFDTIGVILSLA